MRIGIIAPNFLQPESGNHVTVQRIQRTLGTLGCRTKVFPAECLASEELLAGVREFAPQLLHAFHGYSGGRVAHALSQTLGIPYLITLTGTDIYEALEDQRSFETHGALRGATKLVAFHACIKNRLAQHLPTLQERTTVIPQAVDIGPFSTPELPHEGFVFLLPAGLRPAKNVTFALEPLAELYADYPQIRLRLAGPVRDAAYAAEVMEQFERYPFAHFLGAVAHDAMPRLYAGCDAVLNSSHFEGGMANSVLEALTLGKPVLASDIEGNRSVVKDGVTGLLYRDAEEFCEKAKQLLSDQHLRERLVKHGRELVQEKYLPEQEGRAYLDLYREILRVP